METVFNVPSHLFFCFIQTALRSRHSLFARNLLMRPFTGLPATCCLNFNLLKFYARAVPGGEYLFLAVMANRELSGFSEADERIYPPSLTPSQEVLARPSVRPSQGDRCLVKVFSCKRAPAPSESNYYRTGQGERL